MKRYALAPAAIALALSFGSAPAWATGLPVAPAGEQEIEQSIGAVQLQNTNVSPTDAVNAPANVNAPVSVLSHGAGGDAVQENDVEAETETTQGGGSGEQEIEQSIGAVQVQNTNVSPAAAANVPVNANAPISVLSKGGGGNAVQKNDVQAKTNQGRSCGCGTSSSSQGAAEQEIEQSIGAVQLRNTNVSPAVAGNAPLNANAPISVLSKGGAGNAVQKNDVQAKANQGRSCGCGTSSSSQGAAEQEIEQSIGAVQLRNTNVSPAVAANVPVNANAPISVLSRGGGRNAAPKNEVVAETETKQGGGSGKQEIEQSVGALQAQNTNVSPAVAANAPVIAYAPLGVLSKRGGGNAVQKNGVEAATTYAANASGVLPFTGASLVWAVFLWLALTSGATALATVRRRLT